MRWYAISVSIFIWSILLGCDTLKTSFDVSEELDIYEAALKYELEKMNEWLSETKTTVCIGSKRAFELDSSFIGRFGSFPFQVKNESSCDFDSTNKIIDLETGYPGLKIFVGNLQFIGRDSAKTWVGTLQGNLGGSGATFELKKNHKKWEVKNTELDFISLKIESIEELIKKIRTHTPT